MPSELKPFVEKKKVNVSIFTGLVGIILFFLATGSISYSNIRTLVADADLVMRTHEVILELEDFASLLKDAETGQRGFVITGDGKYLEPYNAALQHIETQENRMNALLVGNAGQEAMFAVVKAHISAKLAELAETIQLRRDRGFEASKALIITDRGKNDMDTIRDNIEAMEKEQKHIRQERLEEMNSAYRVAVTSGLLTALLGLVLSGIVTWLVRRNVIARQEEEWLQSGQLRLNEAIFGEQTLEKLGENILRFIAGYVDAHAGAFFVQGGNEYRRVALYGTPIAGGAPERFVSSEGLLGETAKAGKIMMVRDVPEGYLTVASALGHGVPRTLVIAPAQDEGDVEAVLELGFIHSPHALTLKFLDELSKPVAIAVKSAIYRSNLQNLLEETQRQAEELQAQGEEMRVANEELEEQGRVLKESQTRLEQQHAEMEETNAQLEEQTQLLESQRDDLEKVQHNLQVQATELEQASRYKSDFLANMSHELRTPLNSSLILAKLLADNDLGNLTPEQVRYAETIRTSGNDLLSLINDILDLSKIEAGHMEVKPENISLARLVNDLSRLFDPIARQKNLVFETSVAPECPAIIDSDRQRLEQVLKNLLSNAFKFTERGKVSLTIKPAMEKNALALAISDTGIGIAQEQQQGIFDAFRQADGTISRKYGGTGLGLSISRELARLLGGNIALESAPGQGSTFTLTLPEKFGDDPLEEPRATFAPKRLQPVPASPSYVPQPRRMDDDRERLNNQSRIILVVEDDESFARILYELAHEHNFQCLIATTADEALQVAWQYLPHAVILDIRLPDHIGLSVLDRLKNDGRTRHIPVHVISASDYTHAALSLGAAGYMLKPVKREELVGALKKLEDRLSQRVRQVLIVEDDPVQRDNVVRLISSQNVKTVAVGTAAECLEQLKKTTFDCMVLDLTLPDASGYALLDTLNQESAYSFPPVIVYTAGDISREQEQKLSRYSKSIIIKGTKSPERLLDEVTLFLHQVVSKLPPEQQRLLEKARNRDAVLEGRRILVVEDDVRNVYALTSIFEPRGAVVQIARNGNEALEMLKDSSSGSGSSVDLVLMDVMMPEMDGMTATREIRKNPKLKKLPIIMLTAKAMKDDQERCLAAGANDYMAKPLDVEKLLSLVRVWLPR